MRYWTSLAALSLTVAAAGVHAQSATLWVQFGSGPHWTTVSGTRVDVLPEAERPDYDVFRYNGAYYAYQNGNWYTSRRESGQYTMIDDRSVPDELLSVPRERWRNYPGDYQGRSNDQGTYGGGTYGGGTYGGATLRITYAQRPHWAMVPGTRVEMVSVTDRPNYDVLRFGGTYYAYGNGRWYSASYEDGDFREIDERSVPTELTRVPRDRWRSYPTSWMGRYDQGNYRGYGYSQGPYSGYRSYGRYDRDRYGTYSYFTVYMRHHPRWDRVPGTRVRMIRESDRPDYDMFSYGGRYYVYDEGRWYMSTTWRGSFRRIDDQEVPAELARVPRDEWHSYPVNWPSSYGDDRYWRRRYDRDRR